MENETIIIPKSKSIEELTEEKCQLDIEIIMSINSLRKLIVRKEEILVCLKYDSITKENNSETKYHNRNLDYVRKALSHLEKVFNYFKGS